MFHPEMLAARKASDETAALRWEKEKKKLKAARRMPGESTAVST
jgi:hypothetical protein